MTEDGKVWDAAAGLWRTPEELAEQEARRAAARAVLGSEDDTAALNRYERGLG